MQRVSSTDALRSQQPQGAGHAACSRIGTRLAGSRSSAYRTAASLTRTVADACQRRATGLSQLSQRLRRGSAQVMCALSGSAPSSPRITLSEEQLELDLDWRPAMTISEQLLCWGLPIVICCIVYAWTAPAAVSIPYATCIGVLFGVLLVWVRSAILEGMYKTRERLAGELGDPDSMFQRLENILVHMKSKSGNLSASATSRPLGVHCYHGFGSNTWSWSKCQATLAQRLGAVVTAHDMPGFGLTERPTDMSAYCLSFNARLGRVVLDHQLSAKGLLAPGAADAAGASSYPHTQVHEQAAAAEGVASPSEVAENAQAAGLESSLLPSAAAAAQGDVVGAVEAAGQTAAATLTGSSGEVAPQPADGLAPTSAAATAVTEKVQRVLIGHSLGACCAALEYIADPPAYAALVLVDPAILSTGPSGKDKLHLEQIWDGSAFVQSLGGSGGQGAAATAAGYAAAGSSALAGRTGSGEGGSSVDLEQLAGSDLERKDTLSSSNGSNSSSNGGSSPRVTTPVTAAGEQVTYYKSSSRAGATAGAPGEGLLGGLLERVQTLLQAGALMTIVLLLSLLRPLIILALRSAVRSKRFWQSGLQQAFYDKSKVDSEMVNAYRLPQLVKGWETGMLTFLVARLGAAGTSPEDSSSAGPSGLEDTKLAERLAAAVNKHHTPVLIIHGQADQMVPVENSFRMAKMMADCRVAVLKRSGHCPQEELPEAFAELVGKFLEAVVAGRAHAKQQ